LSGLSSLRLTSMRITLKCPDCGTRKKCPYQVRQGEAIDCAKCKKAIGFGDIDRNVGQTVSNIYGSINDVKSSLEN